MILWELIKKLKRTNASIYKVQHNALHYEDLLSLGALGWNSVAMFCLTLGCFVLSMLIFKDYLKACHLNVDI